MFHIITCSLASSRDRDANFREQGYVVYLLMKLNKLQILLYFVIVKNLTKFFLLHSIHQKERFVQFMSQYIYKHIGLLMWRSCDFFYSKFDVVRGCCMPQINRATLIETCVENYCTLYLFYHFQVTHNTNRLFFLLNHTFMTILLPCK